jgi:hypothetical protein
MPEFRKSQKKQRKIQRKKASLNAIELEQLPLNSSQKAMAAAEKITSGRMNTTVNPHDVLTLQRVSGNRAVQRLLNRPEQTVENQATTQLLRKPSLPTAEEMSIAAEPEAIQEPHGEVDTNRVIQRVPLMTGDEMLAVAPYTTNIFGKKKTTAYNTLVDTLAAYWSYASGSSRTAATLVTKIDAVLEAANAWWAKHGASKKTADATKQPAVHKTRVAALKLKSSIEEARAKLNTDTASIEAMYTDAGLWTRITDWATNPWFIADNTNFYTAYRTFTTVEQGKEIIAKHLLDRAIPGSYPASPELFNVNASLFAQARALVVRPNGELTVDMFQTLFAACSLAAKLVWTDISNKARFDTAQGGRDSFVFAYTLAAVPDITGG